MKKKFLIGAILVLICGTSTFALTEKKAEAATLVTQGVSLEQSELSAWSRIRDAILDRRHDDDHYRRRPRHRPDYRPAPPPPPPRYRPAPPPPPRREVKRPAPPPKPGRPMPPPDKRRP